eukprot:647347-Alexandrium_andersonii.AAC.1
MWEAVDRAGHKGHGGPALAREVHAFGDRDCLTPTPVQGLLALGTGLVEVHGLLVEAVDVWLVAKDLGAEVPGRDDVRPHYAEPLLQHCSRHLAHTVRGAQGNAML